MHLFLFGVLLITLNHISAEDAVSDTYSDHNQHKNSNTDDISSNFSADMEIASESDEEQITSSDSVKHFDGFLLDYFKYLKVPGHCSGTCNGPKLETPINLDPIFSFIKYITKCDLTKNVCKNHQSKSSGITWQVSTKLSKNGKIILVSFKDQHGNLVQAQKWIKSKKLHVHIQNKEGLFIKLSGQSLDKGPTSDSTFRLFSGDKAGNYVKQFESNKKRRVKFLDVDSGEDEENSYTIHLKNFKPKANGRWCSKCEDRKSYRFSSSNPRKISFQWVGYGPKGFGFGSPAPTKDCGCEKHEEGEGLGLDFHLFKEDSGESEYRRHSYKSGKSSNSGSSSGAEGGTFGMFGGGEPHHHKVGHKQGRQHFHGREFGFDFGGGSSSHSGSGSGSHQFGFDQRHSHFGFHSSFSAKGGGRRGHHSHGGGRHHSCERKSSSSESEVDAEVVEFSKTEGVLGQILKFL